MKKTIVLISILLIYLAAGFSFVACGEKKTSQPANTPDAAEPSTSTAVKVIGSVESFQKIVESSPNRLMVFDLYADWCGPCKILSPMLDEIAKENKEKADFYKINVDQLPQLAGIFKVSGIPHVSFVKGKTIYLTLVGVRPKSAYVKAVNRFSAKGDEEQVSKPDGEIVETEYYSGYLPGATLIPLQQLADRFSEIRDYKDKEILIYCRSGNRSTVAAG